MASITTRAGKGSPLTNTEVDSNFTNLNTDKIENVSEDTAPQLGGDLDTNGNDINFGDNDKAQFGAGNDLQIYHDGSHSRIVDTGTGVIDIKTNGYQVQLSTSDDEMMLKAEKDSAVTLYHDNSSKLATTSNGVDVTGTVTADGLTVDGGITVNQSSGDSVNVFRSGDYAKFAIGEDSSNHWYMQEAGSNDLYLARVNSGTGSYVAKFDGDGDISFYEDTGTTAKFFWDASEEQLNLTGNFTGKAPFNTFSGSYTAEYNSYGAEAGFQIMSYQSDNGSPYTKTSDLIANGDSTVPSEMRFLTKSNGSSSPAERMRIDSSGNVGIGTNSPKSYTNYGALTIDGTSGGTLALTTGDTEAGRIQSSSNDLYIMSSDFTAFRTGGFTNADEAMRIDSSGNVGIGMTPASSVVLDVTEGDSNKDAILGLSAGTGARAQIRSVLQSDDTKSVISFHTTTGSATSEVMRIDSSGNLLVGKSSTAAGAGVILGATGVSNFTADGDKTLILNRETSDGQIVEFRKDNTTVGSIVANGGDIIIGTGDTGLKFHDTNNIIYPANTNGSLVNNAIGLGASSYRFQTIYSTRGINSESTDTGWSSLIHKKSGSVNLVVANYGTNMTIRDTQKTNQPGFNFGNTEVLPAGGSMYYASSNGVLNFGSSSNAWKGLYARNLYTAYSGSTTVAQSYGVRVWVNFDGEGTIAIRDSGGVSSVTDLGTGRYRINFSTTMPDDDYAAFATSGIDSSSQGNANLTGPQVHNHLTTSGSCSFRYHGNGGYYDNDIICYMAIR